MTTIVPTVGRVVWFHPSPNTAESGFTHPAQGQPLAAIVAHVHSPNLVNLAVFDADGRSHSRTSVPLHQGSDERPQGFYCEWMPYQKGQAAKTEALQAAVDKAA